MFIFRVSFFLVCLFFVVFCCLFFFVFVFFCFVVVMFDLVHDVETVFLLP